MTVCRRTFPDRALHIPHDEAALVIQELDSDLRHLQSVRVLCAFLLSHA